MSRKYATILLAFLFFTASGVANSANAQTESLTLPTMNIRPGITCTTLLTNYFVMQNDTCDELKLSQVDRVAKAVASESATTNLEFSYTTEPTYYTPPVLTHVEENQTPAITSTPSETQTPNSQLQTPIDKVQATGPNLNPELVFQLINAHRVDIGKPAFVKDEALCSLASTRSSELYGELFEGKGYLHSGLYNRNLPYWITENAKWGSNEAGTVQWWLHSPIHRSAIEGDYMYSCGACQGSMCSQLFTSYTPKGTPTTPLDTAKQ